VGTAVTGFDNALINWRY